MYENFICMIEFTQEKQGKMNMFLLISQAEAYDQGDWNGYTRLIKMALFQNDNTVRKRLL